MTNIRKIPVRLDDAPGDSKRPQNSPMMISVGNPVLGEWGAKGDGSVEIKKINNLHAVHHIIERMEASKESLENLLYELPEVLMIVDDEYRILKCNRSAEDLFVEKNGAPKAGFLGQTLDMLFSKKSFGRVKGVLSEVSTMDEEQKIVEFELLMDGQTSAPGYYRWTIRSVPNISKRRGGLYYVVAYDISAAKALLDEMKSKQLELEETNRKLEENYATIAAQKQNLYETARLAQLGEMAAGIAHEINNPVAIICGYTSLLTESISKGGSDVDSKSIANIVTRIGKTAHRIGDIVKSMKLLSRESNGDSFVSEDLGVIIRHALVLFKEKTNQNDVRLIYKELADPVYVMCRPAQIAQIITNLLGNAYYAIQNLDEKSIEISVVKSEGDIQISVTDSGERISDELIAKIMQPFFTTKPPGEGTGIGLSISGSIASEHGGKLFVDCRCATTRFVLQLPATDELQE